MKLKSLIIILIIAVGLLQAQDIRKLKVIMIGIGAPNPTLDHGMYPHLKFYYNPDLKSQAELDANQKSALSLFGGTKASREIFKGEPKILADWWDEIDLRGHAVLFDKNGVGYWQGWLDRRDNIFDSRGFGDEKVLEDAFENIFEDNEIADYDDDKEFEVDEDDNLIERKMIDFNVVGKDNQPKSINSLVETGVPTMIVFSIPVDIDINAIAKEEKNESLGGFLGSLTQTIVGYDYQGFLAKVESLFD